MGAPLSYQSRVREVRGEARALIARLRAERLAKRLPRPQADGPILAPTPSPTPAADALIPSRRALARTQPAAVPLTEPVTTEPVAPPAILSDPPPADADDMAQAEVTPADIPAPATPDEIDAAAEIIAAPGMDVAPSDPWDLPAQAAPTIEADGTAAPANAAPIADELFFLDDHAGATCSLDDQIVDSAPPTGDAPAETPDAAIDYAALLVEPVETFDHRVQTLDCVPKLGAGMIWRLRQLGYVTIDDLAAADAGALRQKLGAVGNMVNVEAWIAFARAFDGTAATEQRPRES